MQCPQCSAGFEFMDADLKVHEKMNVPPPALCPLCRQQRRLARRNDKIFYKNTCMVCHKGVVSMYSSDKSFPVLCAACFWLDQWSPLAYGRDYDFSRPFFEQFAELQARVPRLAMYNTQSENSDYTAHSSRNRNCYMGSSLVDSEDVHYSDWAMKCRDSVDILFCVNMELCYECLDSQDCTNCNYLELCSNLTDSFFAFDCRGGKRMVGCVSMRNRKNHILNHPASKEECVAVIQRLKNDPEFFKEFHRKYEALKAQVPKRESWMTNAENCTGNYISNSKNVAFGFVTESTEDARYVFEVDASKDIYDATRTLGEFLYEVQGIVDLKFGKFCNLVYHCDNMAYCDNCQNSHFSFGCISLKRHQYCVLNKQYTADEYRRLVPKIIEHMKSTGEYGEFFPVALSPFAYNETKAQEYHPLTREQAASFGWSWNDHEAPMLADIKKIPAHRLPDRITEVPDDILNWAVECEATRKPFKIAPQELKFYRRKGLPIPHRSPRQRFLDRLSKRNPARLYERVCDFCEKQKIRTTYAPDRPEKVYCEACFLKTVY